MDQQTIQPVVDRVAQIQPEMWLLIVWGATMLLGLALWSLGGRLARPSCTLSGLVIGASIGYAASQLLTGADWVIALVIAGAVIGGLIAWLLFRVWMAISLAGLLALVVPLGALSWDGRTVTDVTGEVTAPSLPDTQALSQPMDIEQMKEQARILGETYVQQLVDLAKTVWADLDATNRSTIGAGAGAGALAGLLLGLMLPYFAAALEAAIVGGSLMLVSAVQLMSARAPEQAQWLIASPRRWFIILSLITIIGATMQWTVLRKKADSK